MMRSKRSADRARALLAVALAACNPRAALGEKPDALADPPEATRTASSAAVRKALQFAQAIAKCPAEGRTFPEDVRYSAAAAPVAVRVTGCDTDILVGFDRNGGPFVLDPEYHPATTRPPQLGRLCGALGDLLFESVAPGAPESWTTPWAHAQSPGYEEAKARLDHPVVGDVVADFVVAPDRIQNRAVRLSSGEVSCLRMLGEDGSVLLYSCKQSSADGSWQAINVCL